MNKATKLFHYLAEHGETSRAKLMKVVGTRSVDYFDQLLSVLRQTQGVFTIGRGANISYELSYAVPYSYNEEMICGHKPENVRGNVTKWCGQCADESRAQQYKDGVAI